jgi:hypothetical protein
MRGAGVLVYVERPPVERLHYTPGSPLVKVIGDRGEVVPVPSKGLEYNRIIS